MTVYPSYVMGVCAKGQPCAKRNPEECRKCRQKNKEEVTVDTDKP